MKNKNEYLVGKNLILAVLGGFLFLLLMFSDVGRFIKTSVISLPEHAAFDGTVYPFQKVPNWVALGSTEWKNTYSQIDSSKFVSTPYYDPSKLSISTDNLKWGNKADDAVRVAKITYPVPYMGNYELDGKENAGSHPAVDIKMPYGTPIFSVANGVVEKVAEQSSGFGYHVVVQTRNAPSPNKKGKLENLHFSYSHLSAILVEEGDVVEKGQQIALSGDSGTATTPHLHFQLDNDNAPWHPFWPFTNSESNSAGLSFFEAINAGLGADKANEATDNPMAYVQAHLDGSTDYVVVEENYTNVDNSVKPSANSAGSYVDDSSFSDGDVVEDSDEDVKEEFSVPELTSLSIIVPKSYYKSSIALATFQVKLLDQNGNTFTDGFAGEMIISSARGDVRPKEVIVNSRDFEDGILINKFSKAEAGGNDRIEIKFAGETYSSEWFDILDADGDIFSDVSTSHPSYEAISYLVNQGIISGYPDGSFKPNNVVSRVEALKMILEGINSKFDTGSLPFSDASVNEWYGKYLYTAYKGKIVNGYPDGSFRPSSTVNKVEFYKILFNSMDIGVGTKVSSAPFKDVPVDAWFAPYVSKGKKLGVIEDGDYFKPEVGMKRSEVAEAMYRVMTLDK